jgi:hypothetical protein
MRITAPLTFLLTVRITLASPYSRRTVVDVELLYIEGCLHWQTAADRLQQVAAEFAATVRRRCVTGDEDPDRAGFAGSPIILINGRDPFPGGALTWALSCRLYQTPDGPAGSSTIDQIRAAIEGVGAIDTD